MEAITAVAQTISPDATPTSIKSDESTPPHDSGRGSPPPNCSICLGRCKNKSFTDSCLHQFCFKCLLTWSKVKPECPLCKETIRSIIHNVRSNHQYEEYMVEQRHTEEITERIDIDSLSSVNRRFGFRMTLTLLRREAMAIQRLSLQYPPPPSHRSLVYRHNLWSRPLPDFTGRFRDCSPQFYRLNESQLHRLVPWLIRELCYLLNENAGHIAYVIARLLELLRRFHIASPELRDALARYIGARTEHFLHELYCFASTPFDLVGYDRNVQFTINARLSIMVTELSSTDLDASHDSDIVMVSSSHPAPSELPAGPSRPHTSGVIPIEIISHSDSDDSSEVMDVGYIKPPAEWTPEVDDLLSSDLLSSDSDVVVQEEPAPSADSASAAPTPSSSSSSHTPARRTMENKVRRPIRKKRKMRKRRGTSSSRPRVHPRARRRGRGGAGGEGELRRLRSVVNVIGHKDSGDSGYSGTSYFLTLSAPASAPRPPPPPRPRGPPPPTRTTTAGSTSRCTNTRPTYTCETDVIN